jgi:EAL domain-containing protein (putative c-di-GMP-specific phosphodiesterase class I)
MIDFENARRRRQFFAYYQPIVDLATGEIVRIEARARHCDDNGEIRSAGAIIQAARTAEDVWLFERSILDEVAELVQQPRTQTGLKVPVALNLSSAICRAPQFATDYAQLLEKSDLSPVKVAFEVSSDALSGHKPSDLPLVAYLAEQGYEITAGNVDAAEQVPVAATKCVRGVKISESVVSAIPHKQSTDAVLELSRTAKKHGMTVGAEGVSTLEQLRALPELGCSEAQGPLISKPRSGPDLRLLLERGRCW